MKSILIGIAIVSIFILRPAPASAICNITLTNCLTDDLDFCSYSGDSWWDKLVAADRESQVAGATIEYGACNSSSSCYFVVKSSNDPWFCSSPDETGYVDCDEYACVDDSDGVVWYSGSSAYSCSDNTCTSDSD